MDLSDDKILLKEFLQCLKYIKAGPIVDLVVDILFRISYPALASWHLKACSVYNLSFDTGSCTYPSFNAGLSKSKLHFKAPSFLL